MSVTIVTRKTERGAVYFYVEEDGRRLAQCRKRKHALRIQKALRLFAGESSDTELADLLARDRAARAEADQQEADQVPTDAGLVIARRLPE